jgi:hypothetical protein
MHYSVNMKVLLMFALAVVIASKSMPVLSQVEVGRGGSAGVCFSLVNDLQSRWSDVKHHMLPSSGKLKRPKDEDFVCLNPNVVRNSLEKRLQTSANIKCYSQIKAKGLGICCDNPTTTCTQLNPGLFPELMREQKQDAYEPPKSNWVKPPSESDQWGSN